MADSEIRKLVDIDIGTEVENPKFGIDMMMIANAVTTRAHLQSLPNYKEDGNYIYATFKTDRAQELKDTIEEFINTLLTFLKEVDPTIEAQIGEKTFGVGIHDGLVIVAVNMVDHESTREFVEMCQKIASDTFAGEVKAEASLLFDKTFNELLTLPLEELQHVKARLHFFIHSSKQDKYALKRKAHALMPLKGEEGEILGKLWIMMFSTAELHIKSRGDFYIPEEAGKFITGYRTIAEAYIQLAQNMYQEQGRQVIDSLPFIHDFIEKIEQFSIGMVTVGLYDKLACIEADIYGSDFGQLYRRIVS